MRILSFNWHEPYLCMLARTGHHFLVVEPLLPDGSKRGWNDRMRPKPDKIEIVSQDDANRQLNDGLADLVICHNVKDLLELASWPEIPKILVFHNRLTTEIGLGDGSIKKEDYLKRLEPHLKGVKKVFISQSKKDDWGIKDGTVILPGIDGADYGGYIGDTESILIVGNHLRERDLMLGFSYQRDICKNLPTAILGENPTLNSRVSESWDDLKSHYRHCRVYLNTTVHPYEDGYNLALLEAMATGMPVISLENPTSPITDGVEGYIGKDLNGLNKKGKELLADPELAMEMGKKARETALRKFPIKNFINNWNTAIDLALKPDVEVSPSPSKIWMDYAYYPATTAHYIRRAISAPNAVITSGSSITPEIIEKWNLKNMKAEIRFQDVPRSRAGTASSIFDLVSVGGKPDIFLWVDTGLELPPQGIENMPLPKAAYLIDTHINYDAHLKIASLFDAVFLAQREYIEGFKKAGIKNVFWLPLACDPEVHGKKETEKLYDIGFVGSITPAHQRRKALIESLISSGLKVDVKRLFLEEMAEHFSASRIVFNNAIKNDLNMRVFEALCSGSLLLTDKAEGLADLFTDGKHLAVYEDEKIAEIACHYLQNEREREEIAEEGRREVLAKHTYAHRVREIVSKTREISRSSITIESSVEPGYYQHERSEVIAMVPDSAKKILEIGCASGATGAALKEADPEREVIGVEFNPDAAQKAGEKLDSVFVGDIEKMELPYEPGYFDCIVYADVLEHLKNPEEVLKKHKELLAPDGSMVMSIPNVQHFTVVNQLIEGRWTYSDEGLLDRTHLRFFTVAEIEAVLKRAGLSSYEIRPKVVDDIYKEGAAGTLNIGRWRVDNLSKEEMLGFFAFQYIIRASRNISEIEEALSETKKAALMPEHFKNRLKVLSSFQSQENAPFDKALKAVIKESPDASELVDALMENCAERLDAIGHMNMALGRFKEAGALYEKIVDNVDLGLSELARGLLQSALATWWDDRNSGESAALFEKYSKGENNPELTALAPICQTGKGVGFELGETEPSTDKSEFDYVYSNRTLESEADIVGKLLDWKDRLKPGGIIGIVMGDDSGSPETSKRHSFNLSGFLKLVSLIEGFDILYGEPVLRGRSFAVILQKTGGEKFDYKIELNALLSRRAMEQSREYWSEKKIEACFQSVSEAVLLDRSNYEALSRLGDCLQRRGDVAEAEKYYLESLEITKNENALIGLGTLGLARSDFEKAAVRFEAALELSPKSDRALCGLGLARYHSGAKEGGFELYKEALSINPENMAAIASLLKAAYELERFEEADDVLKKYLELHPANTDILFARAGVSFRLNRLAEAEEAVDKILLFKPDYEDAISLLEKIKEQRTVK